ncbi:MAG: hypothetical protein HC873_12480 [Leptolyngbyaceae cyanobacterium SL_1_1]|nr:hypothetical protein [Leptolyngbyaceae cyanobacterium SL_1_1]
MSSQLKQTARKFFKNLGFSEQFQTAAAREGSSIRREESQLAALIVDDVLSQDEADDNHSAIGSPDVNTYLEDSAVAPAVIAQAATIPNGQVPAGIPVPWTLSQVPSGVPQAGFPATPSAAGSWVMVWIPNGSSPVPIGSDGSAANLPNNIPQQAYYQAWMPVGTPGQTLPGNVPWANPAASSGYGYPYGGAPSQPALSQPVNQAGFFPSAVAPQTYGIQPQPDATQYLPAQISQGYYVPPVLPGPGVEQPLVVPFAPGGSGSVPVLPSPPPLETPTYPTSPDPNPYSSTYLGIPPVATPAAPAVISPPAIATIPTTATALAVDRVSEPITEPSLSLQGLYVLQGEESSARARLSGSAFLTPTVLVGGVLDLLTGPDLTNDDGVQVTELYIAASLPQVPSLRFRFGQLDLTSYFDRNSFAKDISRDFFNSTFQTNPALFAGANVTASRPAGLVQWAITDDINLGAAIFSSDADIGNFAVDGFAGEVSFRTGDLIVRGTFISSQDTQFQNTDDRLEAYGVNAEWFFPDLNLGLFGRYGEVENANSGFRADTYSFGFNVLDVFSEGDRLGLGYGRNLEANLGDGETPDVLELFYDFELVSNIRAGFTFQQRDSLSESFAGFRIRGDLDLTPSLSLD